MKRAVDRDECHQKNLVISPIKMGQEVIIVIGEQLDEDAIRSCLEA